MKKKFLAPVMAMMFAIGLSFATEKSTSDANSDYVMTPNGIEAIDEITNCGSSPAACQAELEQDGPTYPVFDDIGLTVPKTGGNTVQRHRN